MPIFTDGLVVRRDRNLLDDVVTGQFDAAEAAFDQAWFENPTTALRRMGELNRAEQGAIEQQAYPAYGIPERRAEPETPLLSAEQARARVKESGLDLTIDDTGIREGALDILLERKREERQRQLILENAPASTVPLQLLAGFAASAADPINVASAFVPIVGEARMASMLARAGTSVAARAAVRAQVGAVEGAVGAALVEPLVLAASAQDQADYDISDSLLNIAFGTVLGGGLHTAGGAVSDWRRRGVLDSVKAEAPQVAESVPAAVARGDDAPLEAVHASLARGIEADQAELARVAASRAAEELRPSIRAELEGIVAGRLPDRAPIKAERVAIQRTLEGLDGSLTERVDALRAEGMNQLEAVATARQAIAQERQRLTERQAEVDEALDPVRQVELATADLERLQRGEIPERYRAQIAERTGQIASSLDLPEAARLRAESAPWQIRQAALRAAVAQAVSGKPVDVEAVFELADPAMRPKALERLRQPAQRPADAEAEAISRSADEALALPDATDLAGAEKLLADELALTDEMAQQAGLDVAPFFKEADELVADAETYAAAFRASALCQLRK